MTATRHPRSKFLSAAGRAGAATRLIGLTTLEQRRALTAAATAQRMANREAELRAKVAKEVDPDGTLDPAERELQINAVIAAAKARKEMQAARRALVAGVAEDLDALDASA